MTCQNCGAAFDGNFCPVCGAPRAAGAGYTPQAPQPPVRPPVSGVYQPITRKWWFWVLLAVTLIALFITAQMLAPDQSASGSAESRIETLKQEQQDMALDTPGETGDAAAVPSAGEGVSNPFGGDSSGALPSIAETVLLDQDGIRVTATGLAEDEWIGPAINVLIENSTDRTITVQALDVSINGIMLSPIFFCEVAAGKKSNETISFYQTDLDNAGISTIQSIELKIEALDSDSWDTILEGNPITVRTDAPDKQQVLDTRGTPALDLNGLEIIVRGIKTEDSTWGPDIQLFLQNHTGRDITVQVGNFSINGFMVSPIFSGDIKDGKVAYYSISLSKEELDKNGIDEIRSMECSFIVIDPNTWDTIFESDPVTIQFPA
ncbi:hypothetical protein SDC9_121955 [bioreactor metagenome]|uniref:Uncharacterized protein n=1 Tax=bioreactor metagenome TaxID=1076179 RepID=A0A645CDB5_9ZZZZ|nr:hypothetical protein [Christensenella sp.]